MTQAIPMIPPALRYREGAEASASRVWDFPAQTSIGLAYIYIYICSDRMGMSEYVISTEEITSSLSSPSWWCVKRSVSVKKVTFCLFGPGLNLVKIGSSHEVNSHYKPPSRVSIPLLARLFTSWVEEGDIQGINKMSLLNSFKQLKENKCAKFQPFPFFGSEGSQLQISQKIAKVRTIIHQMRNVTKTQNLQNSYLTSIDILAFSTMENPSLWWASQTLPRPVASIWSIAIFACLVGFNIHSLKQR